MRLRALLVVMALAVATALPSSAAVFFIYTGVAGMHYVGFGDLFVFLLFFLVNTVVFTAVYFSIAKRVHPTG